jgi:ABC-2 type transport system permease protein
MASHGPESESVGRHIGCAPGPFNPLHPALWRWHVGRTWKGLLVSSVVLVAFAWLFLWAMSMLKSNTWADILESMRDFLKPGLGDEFDLFATKTGQASIVFRHVVTLLICVGWAVARGSDAVSGEIARGTMEHLLCLPVRRITVLVVPVIVATLGSAVLACALWLGTALGLGTIHRFADLHAGAFVPGAVNLFAMTFAMGGITTPLSSMDHDRWRTIWLASGIFVVASIVSMVAFMWPGGGWLKWLTFLSAFEPQSLILKPEATWTLGLGPLGSVTWPLAAWYNGALAALGALCYGLAAVVFVRRDIPLSR